MLSSVLLFDTNPNIIDESVISCENNKNPNNKGYFIDFLQITNKLVFVIFNCIFMKGQQTSDRFSTPTSIIGKPTEDSPPKMDNIFKSKSLSCIVSPILPVSLCCAFPLVVRALA